MLGTPQLSPRHPPVRYPPTPSLTPSEPVLFRPWSKCHRPGTAGRYQRGHGACLTAPMPPRLLRRSARRESMTRVMAYSPLPRWRNELLHRGVALCDTLALSLRLPCASFDPLLLWIVTKGSRSGLVPSTLDRPQGRCYSKGEISTRRLRVLISV